MKEMSDKCTVCENDLTDREIELERQVCADCRGVCTCRGCEENE